MLCSLFSIQLLNKIYILKSVVNIVFSFKNIKFFVIVQTLFYSHNSTNAAKIKSQNYTKDTLSLFSLSLIYQT